MERLNITPIRKERAGVTFCICDFLEVNFYFKTLYELQLFNKFLKDLGVDYEVQLVAIVGHNRKRYIPRYSIDWINSENVNNLLDKLNYCILIDLINKEKNYCQDLYKKLDNWMDENKYHVYIQDPNNPYKFIRTLIINIV